jgi:pilus assembly protein FimV
MLRRLSLVAFVALTASLPASALDVDSIELKSGLGQPLLAEIPVLSADPAELRKLQVRLASPATFARIGLERPHGVVASLKFKLARDGRGRPVIRVTSATPVEQDFLTFLVQADWGDGRLVREYSVSLSAPNAMASPISPSIELPDVAMARTITRAPVADIEGHTTPTPAEPVQPIPLASAKGPTTAQPSHAMPKPGVESPAKPVSSLATAPTPTRLRGAATGDYGPVQAGDTLSKIAGAYADDRYSLNQAMLALLRVNPGAFIGGNINLLHRGAILHAPSADELSRYDAPEAAAMVQEQVRSWREGRPVPPQPAALPDTASEPPKSAPPKPSLVKASAPRVAAARLEISPAPEEIQRMAAPGAAAAGIGKGVGATAGQSIESSASRSAELEELRTRVAELDQLHREQQELLAIRDAELAARPASRAMPWPWLAAIVTLLLPLAWWLGRRGRRVATSSATGHSRWALGDGVEGDAGEEVASAGDERLQLHGTAQPQSSTPAWHPGMPGAATESR